MKSKTACIGLRRLFAAMSETAMGVSAVGVSAVGVSAVGVYQQYMHFGKLFRHTMHQYKGESGPNAKIRHDENGGKSLTSLTNLLQISYKSLTTHQSTK